MQIVVSQENDCCPLCGGCDEFYGSYNKRLDFHCLHCGFDRSPDGDVVTFPRQCSEWVGVKRQPRALLGVK